MELTFHYFSDLRPVILLFKSNTNAAAWTLVSFLFVKTTLPVTGREIREVNLTL